MNDMFKENLNKFVNKVQKEYKPYYGSKTHPKFIESNKKVANIVKFFNNNLQKSDGENWIKFHRGMGRLASTPWIEITKKTKNTLSPFICIIFSKKTKTPFITLQLAIESNERIIVNNLRKEYQSQIQNETRELSIMDLECEKKDIRGYNYQHYSNIYSEKYRDYSQVNKFIKILNLFNNKIYNTDYKEIEKIYENKDMVLGLTTQQPVIEQQEPRRDLGIRQMTWRTWSQILKSNHQKCAICPYNHTKLLQVTHISFKNRNHSERLNIHNGIVLCPLDYQLYKKGFIKLTNFNNNLFFNIKEKCKTEIREYQRFYKNWYHNDEFKKINLPQSYKKQEIIKFL